MITKHLKKFVWLGAIALVLQTVTGCITTNVEFNGLEEKELKVFDQVNIFGSITVTKGDTNLITKVKGTTSTEGCTISSQGILKLTEEVTANILTTPKVCVVDYTVEGETATAKKNFKFVEGLTKIEIKGVGDTQVPQNTEFDVKKDVTAQGDNGRSATSSIVATSSNCTLTNGKLDTSTIKSCTITYDAALAGKTAKVDRIVEIVDPNAEINLVSNGDFSKPNIDGWGQYFEVTNGGSISYDNGALKLTNNAIGGNTYSNRVDYMNVKYETGKSYKVTFDAKSSINGKKIFVQAGKLLANDPWWTEFYKGPIFTLSTEYQTFSYQFQMKLDVTKDNVKDGGIVFECGTVEGVNIKSDIWFDNVKIIEVKELVLSTIDLTIPGTATIRQDEVFNVMDGVSALGNDGIVYTDKITVSAGEWTITEGKLDTSTTGEVTLTYRVKVGEIETTKTRKITIVDLTTKINLIRDGSFNEEMTGNWEATGTVDYLVYDYGVGADGFSALINLDNVTDHGDWHPQLVQPRVPVSKYDIIKLTFKASSTSEKKVAVKLQDTSTWSSLVERVITVTSEFQEFTIEATIENNIGGAVQLFFGLGKVEDTVVTGDHTFRIDDIFLEKVGVKDVTKVYVNPQDIFGNNLTNAETQLRFKSGEGEQLPDSRISVWYVWDSWNGWTIVDLDLTFANGEMKFDIKNLGHADYAVQFFYESFYIEEAGNYVLTFNVNSSIERVIKVNDQLLHLQVGDNAITLNPKPVAAEGTFRITAQLGNFDGIGIGVLTFKNFVITKTELPLE